MLPGDDQEEGRVVPVPDKIPVPLHYRKSGTFGRLKFLSAGAGIIPAATVH